MIYIDNGGQVELSRQTKKTAMSSEIEPHITKKYEIKKRLGKGVSEI